jgi:carbamoyltransferase
MAVVIALSFPADYDPAVAAVVDGKLVYAIQEERLSRHRRAVGEPPINALISCFKFLKDNFNTSPSDVNLFAVDFDPRLFQRRMKASLYWNQLMKGIKFDYAYGSKYGAISDYLLTKSFGRSTYFKFAEMLITSAIRRAGFETPFNVSVVPVEHHLSHAAAAYYFSSFSDCSVLTIDGTGEMFSTVIWRVRNREFERIIGIPSSYGNLGILWGSFGAKLGYQKADDLSALMDLASYSSGSDEFLDNLNGIFTLNDGLYPFSLKQRYRLKENSSPEEIMAQNLKIVDQVYGKRIEWNHNTEMNKEAARLAYALQRFTENAFLGTGKWIRDKMNERKLVLSGSAALNGRASMELWYSRIFNQLHVSPLAGESGGAVGAAVYTYEHVLGKRMQQNKFDNLYLGPKYTDEEIKETVANSKFSAKYIGDDVNEVAEIIATGKVIAWFQGRSEFVSLGLGNRSIVADPTQAENAGIVNRIMGREYWRQLPSSLMVEDLDNYFVNPFVSEYKTTTFRFKEIEMEKKFPAIHYANGFARPQTVSRDHNKTWYDLIKAFKDLKGDGLVADTSFSTFPEPLVETPKEAIKSFAANGIDAMYLQGWLLLKK